MALRMQHYSKLMLLQDGQVEKAAVIARCWSMDFRFATSYIAFVHTIVPLSLAREIVKIWSRVSSPLCSLVRELIFPFSSSRSRVLICESRQTGVTFEGRRMKGVSSFSAGVTKKSEEAAGAKGQEILERR